MRVDNQIPREYHRSVVEYLKNKNFLSSSFASIKFDERKKLFVRCYFVFYRPVSEREVTEAWDRVRSIIDKKSYEPQGDSNNGWYMGVGIIAGGLSFLAIWYYALMQWGLLLGLVFGWIPAIIGGIIIGLVWPIPALLILYLIVQG